MKNVILPTIQEVHIFNDFNDSLLSQLPELRNVKVFFGYQLIDGKMVQNNQPIEFKILP